MGYVIQHSFPGDKSSRKAKLEVVELELKCKSLAYGSETRSSNVSVLVAISLIFNLP